MFTESPWGPPMALPMWWLADFLQLPQWSFLSTTKETRMRTSRMMGTVIPTWRSTILVSFNPSNWISTVASSL